VAAFVVVAALGGVTLAVIFGDDSDDLPEAGRRCYVFDDYVVIHVRMTIDDGQGIVGEARISTDGGRNFDQSLQFEGKIVAGTTANLDVTTMIGDEQRETRESWTFVDRGLRQGSRIYDHVDCSTVDPTFDYRSDT